MANVGFLLLEIEIQVFLNKTAFKRHIDGNKEENEEGYEYWNVAYNIKFKIICLLFIQIL